MEEQELPEDVLRFIVDRIDSVPHLETLLLLWESPERHWSAGEIAARIYTREEAARRVLQDLTQRRLIAAVGGGQLYVYDRAWDEPCAVMPRLAATYRMHLIRVAKIIHSKASPGVQEFARAFKLKKDD
jgi:hypothetical protein